jgi:regulator of sirC expression with transglutaminase-like and TPR domain
MMAAQWDAPSARAAFATLVGQHGRDVPLDQGAALIAAEECPGLDPSSAVAALDALAADVQVPADASVYEQVARISHHLFAEHGFAGDSEAYDDPENCRLDRVLERHKGLPILLSVVVIEVARRVGVIIDGVGFPGHFVVAPRDADPRFYIDPFHAGRVLKDAGLRAHLSRTAGACDVDPATWERFTASVDGAAVLIRINNNMKRSWARRGDLDGALRAVERNLVLEPDCADHLRDRGMLRARVGDRAGAIEDLEVYLQGGPDVWDAPRVNQVLGFLKRRLGRG